MNKDRIKKVEGYIKDIITKFNYGDLITTEYLEHLLGIDREETEFMYLVGSLKNNLIEYGCILSSVLGQGYKILYPNEVPQEVYKKYAVQSLNRISKGLKIMSYVDRTMLTEDEKRQFENFENLLMVMYKDNENTLLNAQAILNDVKRKELGQ